MSLSAASLALLGIGASFFPQELLAQLGSDAPDRAVLAVQVLGAAFIGMATLNWMSRGAHLGGIYGRPITMTNFFHFAIGATVLVKAAISQGFAIEVTALAAVYALFSAWFGLVLFKHPAAPTA